jgi:hypothetical protein
MKLLRSNPQIQSNQTRGVMTGELDEAAQVETADSVRPGQRCDDRGGSMKLLWLKPQIQSNPTRGATTGGA